MTGKSLVDACCKPCCVEVSMLWLRFGAVACVLAECCCCRCCCGCHLGPPLSCLPRLRPSYRLMSLARQSLPWMLQHRRSNVKLIHHCLCPITRSSPLQNPHHQAPHQPQPVCLPAPALHQQHETGEHQLWCMQGASMFQASTMQNPIQFSISFGTTLCRCIHVYSTAQPSGAKLLSFV
jgi:hypothetical protein